MLKSACPITCLCFLLGIATTPAALFEDDFESNTVGGFPAGWNDVGSAPGATPGSPIPSAVVINTTNALGAPTRAVQIVEANHDSQGIFRPIPDLPYVRVSVDLRIDQFALGAGASADDWAWDVALLANENEDFSLRSSMGVFASALTQGVRTFSSGLSAPTEVDEFSLGGSPLEEGVWYRLGVIFDRVNGIIHAQVVNIADDSVLVSNSRSIPDWEGLEPEPDFTIFGIFDGELSPGITSNNITTIDNVRISEAGVNLEIRRSSPQQITIVAEGNPGTSFNLERIDNLAQSSGATWTNLQQIDFDFEPVEYVDNISTTTNHFYRLREVNP